MVTTPRTVHVEPGSELDEALAEIDERPVEVERAGVRYRLRRVAKTADELLADYDPARAIEGMRSLARSRKKQEPSSDPVLEALRARENETEEERSARAERFRSVLDDVAGSWHDIDAEQLKRDIYRWREEGSRPIDRPRPSDIT